MDIMDKVILGDARTKLFDFPEKCVNTCVTSPPYWGLRDYGTSTWVGGNENCTHRTQRDRRGEYGGKQETNVGSVVGSREIKVNSACPTCGAVREDNQIGLEDSVDGFVESMVEVCRGIRHALRDDGTLWLNLGDSYAGSTGQSGGEGMSTKDDIHVKRGSDKALRPSNVSGLKPKDLIGVPWRVAFALQADGWYLRQDIIWHKPAPMPEPTKDRCVKSHEYIFLLSKEPRYYFDYESIQEESIGEDSEMRNKRNVWSVNTASFSDAHFATFPPDLIIPCVLAGSPEGGLVLDPFMGSGTVAMVSKRLGRHYTGVELNPEYHKIIHKRTCQQELFI